VHQFYQRETSTTIQSRKSQKHTKTIDYSLNVKKKTKHRLFQALFELEQKEYEAEGVRWERVVRQHVFILLLIINITIVIYYYRSNE
jgi:hypothetical protein